MFPCSDIGVSGDSIVPTPAPFPNAQEPEVCGEMSGNVVLLAFDE